MTTKRKFFATVEKYEYEIEEESDRINGVGYDNYMDKATGREIGFISYCDGKKTTYTLNNMGGKLPETR